MREAGTQSPAAGDSLQLVINTESLAPPRTGIGTYTAALIREYLELLPPGAVHAFMAGRLHPAGEALREADAAGFGKTRRREQMLALLYRVASSSQWPYRLHQARNRRAFARATDRLPDGCVYHEPNFILKPFAGARVATVHDLSFLHFPQTHPSARVAWLNRQLPETLAEAQQVITVSDFIRRELIEHFTVDPDRIRTIHPGVSDRFRAPAEEEIARVLKSYGLKPQRFVLCVSTLEPRKNLDTLMDAWQALPQAVRREYRLVIAGSRGWHCESIERRLDKLCADGEAVRPGYVPQADLPALLAGCAVFAYPSAYEGFGLPVLEAMACGAPAVISEDTALAEIAAETVRLVPPRSADALATTIRELLEDEPQRQRLGQAAAAYARRFTWRRAALAHLETFERARASLN